MESADWIRRSKIENRGRLAEFPSELGGGEREAILLAGERGAKLLADDREAREVAKKRGIDVIGSLWVLAEAKRRGIVSEVRPIIKELVSSGYWMHEERLVRPFLREIGEEPS